MPNVRCDWLDWHTPANISWSDGCSLHSHCVRCDRRIMRDSQGNWYARARQDHSG